MATGSTNREVRGLGDGKMNFVPPFQLMDSDGSTELFGVDSSGNVTAAGTFALAGTSNLTITNTAPKLTFVDSTASAKDLTIAVDGDKAQLREDAGAAGSLGHLACAPSSQACILVGAWRYDRAHRHRDLGAQREHFKNPRILPDVHSIYSYWCHPADPRDFGSE